MRLPSAKQKPQTVQVTSFPAPTGGLISNRNLAVARPADGPPGAAVMDNWFPTSTGVVVRRGSARHASVVQGSPVLSIFSYISGLSRQMFAATDEGIRDITNVAVPTDWVGPDVLTGQTSGNWNVVQFATAGGEFLVGVNGADPAFTYDGTAFAAAAITFPTGSTLTTRNLSYVWVYKQRLWFIERDSLNAWYLPVDQIGGELTKLPLGGVFVNGGKLIWGHSWSLDSGSSGGLSEQCVFCTTEGEVAAYQGLSPDVDQGWSKVGVYRIGRPLGDKAFMRAGGDLVIATTVGFVSLAMAARSDYAALGQSAVSYSIEDDWARAVGTRGQEDWRCTVWPDQQMAIISPPPLVATVPVVFVVNTNTGKWSRFTGWPIRSMGLFGGRLYFGADDGSVRHAWVGGTDEGQPYFARMLPLFDDLGIPGSVKLVKMARAIVRSAIKATPQVSAHFNFKVDFPSPPSIGTPPLQNNWDAGIWDESTWDAENVARGDWVAVGGSGHDVSIGVQITSGVDSATDAELVRIDLTFTTGRAAT